MKDRSHKPLAKLGMSEEERAKFARLQKAKSLEKTHPKKAKRLLAEILEDDDLPPPNPTRRKAPAVAGKGGWVALKGSDVHELLNECEDHSSLLNEWEVEFVDSVSEQVARKNGLTERQYGKLGQVVERLRERRRF